MTDSLISFEHDGIGIRVICCMNCYDKAKSYTGMFRKQISLIKSIIGVNKSLKFYEGTKENELSDEHSYDYVKHYILEKYKSGNYVWKNANWLIDIEYEKRIEYLERLVVEKIIKRIYGYRCSSCNTVEEWNKSVVKPLCETEWCNDCDCVRDFYLIQEYKVI